MNLAVFDVDGTLVQSVAGDTACYARALAEACGIDRLDTNWARYRTPTDTGITAQVFQERMRRPPRPSELLRLRDRFAALLSEHRFEATPGADETLRRLPSEGWAVGIATGAWRACALVKLRGAGLDIAALPSAFADDAESKAAILQTALKRAGGPFGRTVYVGDSPWDLAAARELNLPFVAVGRRVYQAPVAIPDFSDAALLMHALGS